MNWKRLEGSPSLHQEMAALTLDDGRFVSIRRSSSSTTCGTYVTLDDILTDYLAVIEGDTNQRELHQGGNN